MKTTSERFAERPRREVEAAHGAACEQADLLAGAQRLDARGHDDVVRREALRDRRPRRRRSAPPRRCAATRCSLAGSTIQTAGAPFAEVSADAGIAMPGAAPSWMRAGDGRAEPHRLRRIGEADPHLEGARHGIGLRRHLAHAAGRAARCGSEVSVTVTSGSRPAAASFTRAGTSKTASRPPWRATRTIIWPAATTSPGSAPTRRHRARRVGERARCS